MNPIEYKITLDCRRAESQVIITAKQGEASGRKITFSLNEGRLPYKVPSGVTAVLRAKKPSGAVLYNTCTVTADGNVEYIITTQTVAEVGKLPCELQLSQDGKVIFSPNFTLLVYKNLSVDSEVESTDEFTALQTAINKAENLAGGTTFTPAVSEDGVLSWTNDGGKTNPEPVNIKGEDGAFRVNVTLSDGAYSADKTFDEIKAAYDAGQQPYVVYGGDTIYALSSCYFASEQMFMDFERYLIWEDALKTETLRIYSYTLASGSNIEQRIAEFNVPSGTTYVKVNSTDDVITTVNGETYTDIQALINAGKPVVVRYEDVLDFYYFETFGFSDSSGIHTRVNFRCDMGSIVYTLALRDDNTWAFTQTSLQTSSITDTGGYFTTDTVEGALQEIGAEIDTVMTLLTQVQKRAPRVFYFSSTENPGELSADDVPTLKNALVDHTPVILVGRYMSNQYFFYLSHCDVDPTAENINTDVFYIEFRTLDGLYNAHITLIGATGATVVTFDTIS